MYILYLQRINDSFNPPSILASFWAAVNTAALLFSLCSLSSVIIDFLVPLRYYFFMTVFFFLAAFLSEILPSANTYFADLFEGSELTHSYRIHSEEEGLWEYREIFPDGREEFAFIVEQSDYIGHIYTIIEIKGDTAAHSFNLSEVLDESFPISEKQSQQISLSDISIFPDSTQEVTENQSSGRETEEAEETEEYTIHMNSERGIIYLGIPDADILLVTRPLILLE